MRVPVDVSEAAAEGLVRATVPGFRPDDVAIAVEPGHLLVAGQKDASVVNVGREPVAQCGDQFFGVADVPPPSDARHEPAPAR